MNIRPAAMISRQKYRKKQIICGKQNGAIKLTSASFESNKAGVCILFNNNFNLQFQRLYTDPAGRFIIWRNGMTNGTENSRTRPVEILIGR